MQPPDSTPINSSATPPTLQPNSESCPGLDRYAPGLLRGLDLALRARRWHGSRMASMSQGSSFWWSLRVGWLGFGSGRPFIFHFFAFRGHHSKPFLGFSFGRQPFVMLVDHGRRVPCLLSGQILVGMERKMVGAK